MAEAVEYDTSQAGEKAGYALAVFSMLLGAVLSPTDYFIVNLALPDIQAGLHASGAQLQFVVSTYAVAYAVGLIPAGRLGDRYGRRRMFVTGVTGFLVSSLLCGLAPNIYVLIAGRLCQGITASMLSPQVLATFRAVLPGRLQTRTIAMYGFMFGLGALIGQVGGGFLIEANLLGLGWHAIFLVNVPVCLVSIAGVRRWAEENFGDRTSRVDVAGVLLLCPLLGLLVVSLALGHALSWPPWCVLCLVACVPAALLFRRFEIARRRVLPLVNFELAAAPVVWRGLLLACLFYTDSVFFMGFGVFLQDGLGWTAVESALAFLPFAAGFTVGPLVIPRLIGVVREWTVFLGFVGMTVGFSLLTVALYADVGVDPLAFAALVAAGAGHGVVLSSLTRVLLMGTPRRWSGQITSLVISSMQIGSASGVAGLGAVLFGVLGDRSSPAAYDQAFRAAMFCLSAVLLACSAVAASLARSVSREQT